MSETRTLFMPLDDNHAIPFKFFENSNGQYVCTFPVEVLNLIENALRSRDSTRTQMREIVEISYNLRF